MDNLGKALHIGVGVLLFIIALTSSVITYGKLMDYIDVGLRVSDDGRRAEVSSNTYGLQERQITHSEVIMTLVQIHSTNATTISVKSRNVSIPKVYSIIKDGDTIPAHQILVNNSPESINEYEFHNDVAKGVYTYSYSEGNKTITFEWESEI
ncbi:MAG: hypothetical protein J6B87_00375 [Clostridia bacterium]|nr:hypothetical protein [Clostridia bacterium]